MNTIIISSLATAAVILGSLIPAQAMPDPDGTVVRETGSTAVADFPFGPGHAPRPHLAGHDWLPARR